MMKNVWKNVPTPKERFATFYWIRTNMYLGYFSARVSHPSSHFRTNTFHVILLTNQLEERGRNRMSLGEVIKMVLNKMK